MSAPTRLHFLVGATFQQHHHSVKPPKHSLIDKARALRIQLLLHDWTTSWGPSRQYRRRTLYVQSTPVVLVQASCSSINRHSTYSYWDELRDLTEISHAVLSLQPLQSPSRLLCSSLSPSALHPKLKRQLLALMHPSANSTVHFFSFLATLETARSIPSMVPDTSLCLQLNCLE